MTTMLLGRPLTFGDDEQIREIKEQIIKQKLEKSPIYIELKDELSEIESDISSKNSEIDDLQSEVDDLESEALEVTGKINALKLKIK